MPSDCGYLASYVYVLCAEFCHCVGILGPPSHLAGAMSYWLRHWVIIYGYLVNLSHPFEYDVQFLLSCVSGSSPCIRGSYVPLRMRLGVSYLSSPLCRFFRQILLVSVTSWSTALDSLQDNTLHSLFSLCPYLCLPLCPTHFLWPFWFLEFPSVLTVRKCHMRFFRLQPTGTFS